MVAILSIVSASLTLLLASQHALAQVPIDPSQIPSACQSECSSIATKANSCAADISCLCTDAFVDALSKCFSCAVGTGLDRATGQSALTQFTDACNTIGHPVKAGSISGSSSGGSSPSGGSSTSSGSSSTVTGSSSSSGSGAATIVVSAGAIALAAVSASLLL